MPSNRRKFLGQSLASVAGIATTMIPTQIFGHSLHNTSRPEEIILPPNRPIGTKESIKFSVIGLNHGHIYGMVDSLITGGGRLIGVYAKEPELLQQFTKRYPKVKIAKNENEIIEDNSIQLVASAAIPIERAPIGIRVMKSGKDFMTDKPGILTLEQFAEVKKIQKETKRIYSIVYSERPQKSRRYSM